LVLARALPLIVLRESARRRLAREDTPLRWSSNAAPAHNGERRWPDASSRAGRSEASCSPRVAALAAGAHDLDAVAGEFRAAAGTQVRRV
jgi:hypothetical protein